MNVFHLGPATTSDHSFTLRNALQPLAHHPPPISAVRIRSHGPDDPDPNPMGVDLKVGIQKQHRLFFSKKMSAAASSSGNSSTTYVVVGVVLLAKSKESSDLVPIR
eukprot:TRINITY_DN5548_c1_g1_i1.p2 TRINITY_DN5548_c1_g1~~TRINITY_DN5548_c1_g1_i1.p2  ORF type:complete len:106 (+),score=13.75 TRINITY_DN5548_c1_g1_i1:688-1005(+)